MTNGAESSERAPLDDIVGQVVANRFQVESVLGVGAMGVVFRARSMGAEHGAVALKVVLPEPGEQRNVPRFLRGTRLAAQVKHPHVVETLAYGRIGPEREGYFVAMELVDGVALSRLVSAGLDSGAVCTLMSQVLDALAFMHARGILHRDIKPDNILVSRAADGTLAAKISDFGIAAESHSDATMLTQPGTVVGTPVYMAPEQMAGKGLDTPTIDLYAVGAILYELLAGRAPFASNSMSALMAKLVEEAPPLAPRDGLALPPGLDDVVMRLIARQPKERFLLAADARGALGPFCGPAFMPAARWDEICTWQPQAWSPQELPSGWGGGHVQLAAGTSSQPPAGAEREGELPMVGRDGVLARIDRVAEEAEAGQVRALLVRGPVGIGKSALVNEATTRLAASGRFLVVRLGFSPVHDMRGVLCQAIEGVLGTAERSTQHVQQAIEELWRRHGDDDGRDAPALAALLRPAAGQAAMEQGAMFALVLRCLRRLSKDRPVLLAADDIQHGGPDAVAFLELLLFQDGFEPFPMLLLGATPAVCHREPFEAAMARLTRFDGSVLHVDALPPLDQDILTSALIVHLALSPTRARGIALRAAGNPLFALHLARAAALASDGAASVVRPATGELVPRPLHEILALSLRKRMAETADPARFRELLEAIAVLGARVDVALIEAFLADDVPAARLDRDLDTCLDLELLDWCEAGQAELVRFVPEVLRDVLLSELNPRRARRLHRRAIEVRQAWAGARVDAEAGALGDHCEAAGRPDEAVDWWLRGQRHAMSGGNLLLGVEWGLKALAAMEPADPRHGPCAITLGRILLDTGDLERAAAVLRPAVEGADADLAMRAGEVLGDVYENLGRGEEWTALCERLSAREHEVRSPAARCALHLARAIWCNHYMRQQEGEQEARRALACAEPGEQAQRAAQRLVFSCLFRGEPEEAERMARRALAESGDRLDLRTRSLRVLGLAFLHLGQVEEARACLQEFLDISRRAGLVTRIPLALLQLGELERIQDDLAAARIHYASAERAAQDLGLASTLVLIHMRQLACDLDEGKTAGMRERMRALQERGRSAGLGFIDWFSKVMEAWLRAHEGRTDEAVAYFEDYTRSHDRLDDPRLATFLERAVACLLDNARGALTPAHGQVLRQLMAITAPRSGSTFSAVWPARAARRRRILDSLPPE